MHQLTIDIGNTNIKIGIFKQREVVDTFYYKTFDPTHFIQQLKAYNIQKAIVVHSGAQWEAIPKVLNTLRIPFIVFHPKLKLSFKNDYISQNTLGHDRLALVEGAVVDYGIPALVISCGTCITYNFIDSENQFLGGGISPGLKMRFKAMAAFTANLPEISIPTNTPVLIGKTTETSIQSGVLLGMIAEIDSFIYQYVANYPNIKLILTGGDADYLETKLKNKIFADNLIILKGLNSILLNNEN